MYYKGFNANLCGWEDYQFEVGQTYTMDIDDTWSWYHYTKYVSATLNYFDKGIRVCEVEPLGETRRFHAAADGFGKGYFTTNKIRILRELTRAEIFDALMAERCSLFLVLKLEPPFEVLQEYKSSIRGNYCHSILGSDYLTDDEKRALLPKSWHRYIEIYNRQR